MVSSQKFYKYLHNEHNKDRDKTQCLLTNVNYDESDDTCIYFSRDIGSNSCKEYSYNKSAHDFIYDYLSGDIGHHIYELLIKPKRKFYINFNYIAEDISQLDNSDKLVTNILFNVIHVMTVNWRDFCDSSKPIDHDQDIMICRSEGWVDENVKKSFKYSHHIIFPTICCSSLDESKALFNALTSHMPNNFGSYLDSSVYDKNRNFRVMFSNKSSSPNRTKIPVLEWKVGYYSGSYQIIHNKPEFLVADSLVTFFIRQPYKCKVTPAIKPYKKVCELVLEPTIKPKQDDIPEGYALSEWNETYGCYLLKRIKPSLCPICIDYSDPTRHRLHNNSCGSLRYVNGNYTFTCIRHIQRM